MNKDRKLSNLQISNRSNERALAFKKREKRYLLMLGVLVLMLVVGYVLTQFGFNRDAYQQNPIERAKEKARNEKERKMMKDSADAALRGKYDLPINHSLPEIDPVLIYEVWSELNPLIVELSDWFDKWFINQDVHSPHKAIAKFDKLVKKYFLLLKAQLQAPGAEKHRVLVRAIFHLVKSMRDYIVYLLLLEKKKKEDDYIRYYQQPYITAVQLCALHAADFKYAADSVKKRKPFKLPPSFNLDASNRQTQTRKAK